jgi:Mrp family chromosome partitioning ATPase
VRTATAQHVSTLRDYLVVLRRRKWTVIATVVLVTVVALAYSLTQEAQYRGSAQVLLSSQDVGTQLTGGQDTSVYTPADRRAQTQADLARVPAVAQRAIRATRSPLTAGQFLANSSVSAGANADILTFDFTSHDPAVATRMATAYARAYVKYRLAVDTAPINGALDGVLAQIAKLPSRGALYTSLEDNATRLRTLAALKSANASVVQVSQSAVQTAPRTKRNVLLGVMLGLLLGVGFAFLRESLDTRIRTAETIGDALRLPLLARLPEPPKRIRADDRLVSVEDPSSVQAESFRMLRTNFEFASLGKDVRSAMVTSATEQEGKSTTVANLAVALARTGRHVVLVDLDLRRPFIDRFFGLGDLPGVTQVAIGAAPLGRAIKRVPVGGRETVLAKLTAGTTANGNGNGDENGHADRATAAVLDVLPSGPLPPDPGEFVGTARLTEILEHLKQHCDIVLIDAPPLFHVGDALTLSAKVDAVMVVTNMNKLRRPMLGELKRQLDTMPAHKLGFIVTGAESEESYGYGGYGYYYARPYEHEAVRS